MNNNKIIDVIEKFVKKYVDIENKILVAVSGGPDSMVLLELLSKIPNLKLGVAHVDHRWRTTSSDEAKTLKSYVEGLNIPFHLKVLNPNTLSGNLEDSCRKSRYQFFKQLCDQHGYQGVVTGHHADDQVETILKRFFEGSAFVRLSGIQSQKHIFGVNVFRPLLDVPKLSILQLSKKMKFDPIQDSTNQDPRYMRGRMRSTILPTLEGEFGKNIKKGILQTAEEARAIECYLDHQTDRYMSSIVQGGLGLFVDLSTFLSIHTLELKHFIRRFCRFAGIVLSRDQLCTVCDLVASGVAAKKVILREGLIHVDRRRMFFTNDVQIKSPTKVQLVSGKQLYGEWTVEVSESFQNIESEKLSWMDVWKGELLVYLPKDQYYIGPYEKNDSLNKRWTNAKVPSFLRGNVPVLWKGGAVYREFLSGRKSDIQNDLGLRISLIRNV